MLISQAFTAGQRIPFREPGNFFRLLAATATVNVEFYRQGKEIAEAVGIGAGYSETFNLELFDEIQIQSPTAQTIQFVTRLGNVVGYDAPPAGNVAVTNNGGSLTQTTATVNTTAGNLLAANTARRFLMIQNRDSANRIFVNLQGATATIAGGVEIKPGEILLLDKYAPTSIISAISDLSACSAVVVQG